MADDMQPPLFCSYCEVEGHEVVHCYHLFEYLTTFAATTGFATAQPSQGSASFNHRVARWGGAKKRRLANNTAPSIPIPNHNPSDAQVLGTYLEYQRLYWLWSRVFWARNVVNGSYQQPE
ncbi:unnamed protein product [Penicillium glandicola]